MKTITTTLYLTAFRFDSTPPGEVSWVMSQSKYKPGEHHSLGCWRHDVTLPLPEDFNPVSAEVLSLEAQKLTVLADYQRTVAEINTRLSKLQAITNEVTDARASQ